MIKLRKIRELSLDSASAAQRAHHVSAASGLVAVGDFLYVVTDDEHHLAVFSATGVGEGDLVRIFPGDLPHERRARKADKPDLEVLTRLPPFAGHPYGALLALASGSRPNRRTGVVLPLDAAGVIARAPRRIDLAGVYACLDRQFPALNIEGATVTDDALILLQRGSRTHPTHATIHLSLPHVLDALGTGDTLGTAGPIAVHMLDLGAIDGIPLCFTDGAALVDGRIVFTAVAEDSVDTYEDGPFKGAAIGLLGSDGHLQRIERVEPPHKIEGISASLDGETIRLLLVTDADDANVPSLLLSAEIPSNPESVMNQPG